MTGKVELSTGTVNVVFNYLKRQSWIEVNDIIVTLLRELPQLPLSATFDDAQTETSTEDFPRKNADDFDAGDQE